MACVGGWEEKARDWGRKIWLCLSYFDLRMLLTDKIESILSEKGFCSAALKILHTYWKSAHSLEDQLAWQTLDILYIILKKKKKVFPYKNFLQAKAWHASVCPGAIKEELFISKFSARRSCCIDNTRYQRVLFNPTSCSRANVSSATALYLTVGWSTSKEGVRGSLALQAHSSRKLTFNS